MRRVLAILGACALLISTVGSASAGAPIKESDHLREVSCWEIDTPLGVGSVSAFLSDAWGADASVEVWDGSDYVIQRDWDRAPSVQFGADGSVAATIPVLPSGEATLSGSTTPVEPFSWEDRGHDGNITYRNSATGMSLAFEGVLVLPGVRNPIPVGPPNCAGSESESVFFQTNPNARVSAWTSNGGVCEVAGGDGSVATVFFSLFESSLFLDGWAVGAAGSEVGFYGEGAVGADGSASFTTVEYDPETGAETGAGDAWVTLTDTGEAFDYRMRYSTGFQMTRGTVTDVEGALATSIGSFDLGACVVTALQSKEVAPSPQGPKPGGKRPANDLPSGAITLKAGSRAVVATKGAQQPREADYTCLQGQEEDGSTFEIPVLHTVWYRIVGKGAWVTIDTAGSDFDTVTAVYEGAPDAGATVACVDDVPLDPVGRTLQSAVGFQAAAGVTYWVQIGGFDQDIFGEIPDVAYGTLKVAVR